jgi:hypothetical protein
MSAWVDGNVKGLERPQVRIAVHQRQKIVRSGDVHRTLRRFALRPRAGDHLLGYENEDEDQQHERH